MFLQQIIKKYGKIINTISGVIIILIGALWALVTLIYPNFIVPAIQPGKLEISVESNKVGVRPNYSVFSVNFKLNNIGNNKIYVPATYFLAKAFTIEKTMKSNKKGNNEEKEKAIKDTLRNTLAKHSKDEIKVLKAEASNYLFVRELIQSKNFKNIGKLSQYSLSNESSIYLHMEQLTGLHNVLEPGEITRVQTIVLVPKGYDVLEILCKSIFAKEKIDNVVFIGLPMKSNIVMYPISNDDKKSSQIESLLKKTKKQEKYKELEKNFNSLPSSTSQSEVRVQLFIGDL